MKKIIAINLIFLSILIISSCEKDNNLTKLSDVTKDNKNIILKQGPNSTGGLFRITDKNNQSIANSKIKILSVNNNIQNELAQTYTDKDGNAFLDSSIITTDIIKGLKDKTITLIIFVNKTEGDFSSEIKNIEFKSNNLIYVEAQSSAPTAQKVNVSQKSLNLSLGKTSEILAEVEMSDGSKSNSIVWTSSDETVATIKNGKISTLKKGVTILTASANADLSINNKIVLTVTDETTISLVKIINPTTKDNINSPINIKKAENMQLQAISLSSDGSSNSNIIWKSSDESILVVGKNTGIITGISKGKATLTATSSEDISKSSSIDIIVE